MIQISADIILKPLSIDSAPNVFKSLKRFFEMMFGEMGMNRVQMLVDNKSTNTFVYRVLKKEFTI